MRAIPLLAALLAVAQHSPEVPDAWKRYTDAAEAARKAGHLVKAEALIGDVFAVGWRGQLRALQFTK